MLHLSNRLVIFNRLLGKRVAIRKLDIERIEELNDNCALIMYAVGEELIEIKVEHSFDEICAKFEEEDET